MIHHVPETDEKNVLGSISDLLKMLREEMYRFPVIRSSLGALLHSKCMDRVFQSEMRYLMEITRYAGIKRMVEVMNDLTVMVPPFLADVCFEEEFSALLHNMSLFHAMSPQDQG